MSRLRGRLSPLLATYSALVRLRYTMLSIQLSIQLCRPPSPHYLRGRLLLPITSIRLVYQYLLLTVLPRRLVNLRELSEIDIAAFPLSLAQAPIDPGASSSPSSPATQPRQQLCSYHTTQHPNVACRPKARRIVFWPALDSRPSLYTSNMRFLQGRQLMQRHAQDVYPGHKNSVKSTLTPANCPRAR